MFLCFLLILLHSPFVHTTGISVRGARWLGDPWPRGASQEPAGRRSIASRLPGRPARAIAPLFCASPSRRWSRRSVSRRSSARIRDQRHRCVDANREQKPKPNDRKLEEIFAAKELVDADMQDFDRKLMKLRLIKNG